MQESILIVEDEEDIIELISFHLIKEGYQVSSLMEGNRVFETAKAKKPDLILLDLMLPGLDGLSIIRQLKGDPETKTIPVIIVSAKSEETDIVIGLELGAEDYVTKPFSPKILTARIRTALRRQTVDLESTEAKLIINKLVMLPEKREAEIDGKEIDLTFSEYQALWLLASHPGRVYTRYQIVEKVHGSDYAATDRSIDVLIVSIRKKLGNYAHYIETKRGVGYRFKETL